MEAEPRPRDPEIQSYPSQDDRFHDDVVEALDRSRATIEAGWTLLEAVRRDLRERYPAIEIHERDSLAALGDVPPRWYVYRDGRIA